MPCRDQFSLYHRRSPVFSRKVRMLWVMSILTDISIKIRRSSHPGTLTMSGMLHPDNCRAGVGFRPHPSKSGGRACENLMHVGASKLPRRVTRALKLVRGLGVQRMYAGRPHLLVRSCRRRTGLDAWFYPDKGPAHPEKVPGLRSGIPNNCQGPSYGNLVYVPTSYCALTNCTVVSHSIHVHIQRTSPNSKYKTVMGIAPTECHLRCPKTVQRQR